MDPVIGLALGRTAIGLAAVARPDSSMHALGLDAANQPNLRYATRLAGARDIALGAATLLAPRGARKALLGIGMAVDASDAYAGYEQLRSGAMSKLSGTIVTAPAVLAVVAGAVAIATERAR